MSQLWCGCRTWSQFESYRPHYAAEYLCHSFSFHVILVVIKLSSFTYEPIILTCTRLRQIISNSKLFSFLHCAFCWSLLRSEKFSGYYLFVLFTGTVWTSQFLRFESDQSMGTACWMACDLSNVIFGTPGGSEEYRGWEWIRNLQNTSHTLQFWTKNLAVIIQNSGQYTFTNWTNLLYAVSQ